MYEPKYKLNKRDEARWYALAAIEALRVTPMTDAEKDELERLQRKRHRRLWSHPKMEPVKRAQRNSARKVRRLIKRLQALGIELKC